MWVCVWFLLVLSGTETSFPLKEIKKKKTTSLFSARGGTEHVLLDTSFMKYSFFPPSFFRVIKKGERTETPLTDGEYSPLKASVKVMFTPVPLPAKVPLLLPAHKTAEHLQFKVLSKEAFKKEHLKQFITMIY